MTVRTMQRRRARLRDALVIRLIQPTPRRALAFARALRLCTRELAAMPRHKRPAAALEVCVLLYQANLFPEPTHA